MAIMLAMFTHGSFGQDFEWVRSYTGSDIHDGDNTNDIKGSFVDSQGNVYIIGNMSPNGRILGVDLLPPGLYSRPFDDHTSYVINNISVVIAKISPEGQLLWHKAIFSSKCHSTACSICKMGDTAFMVMVNLCKLMYQGNPREDEFIYYLDTLITDSDSAFLAPRDSSSCQEVASLFITFDLDGNVQEQHILEVGYIESSGQTVTCGYRSPWNPTMYSRNPNALLTYGLSHETFAIDHDGNIYVARKSYDRVYIFPTVDSVRILSISDGSISALKILVDGRCSFVYRLDRPTPTWNQQILKFAPHFDSLLGSVYVFDSTNCDTVGPRADVYSIDMDRNDNLYVSLYYEMPPQRMYIANSDSLFVRGAILPSFRQGAVVLVYNQDLQAVDMIKMSSDNEDSATAGFGNSCYFDDESNSMFVQGMVGWWGTTPNYSYRGEPVDVPINGTYFWLRLDMVSHDLLSYGLVRPQERDGSVSITHTAAKNNRVFSEIRFWHLLFADTLQTSPRDGLAFAVWDYDGHELQILNHNVSNPKNRTGRLHVLDSVVYITGTMHEDAAFGSITLHNSGNSEAFVARYVDTSLMTPYVWHETRTPQTILWSQTLDFSMADSVIQLTATSTSGLTVKYSSSNTDVARVRGDRLYLLAPGTAVVTARQIGDRQYQPAARVSKQLTVSDGDTVSIAIPRDAADRVKVYPNPSRGEVNIHCRECTVHEVGVISLSGRYERLRYTEGRVDVSHLAAGVYYLQIVTTTDVHREKIVVGY